MPDWLSAARNVGVNPDFFRIAPAALGQPPERVINPRQFDLFR
jgi:hypothetical protein